MNAEGFVSHLSEDAIFKFGNADAVAGKAAIQDAVAAFFGSIKGIRHHLLETWAQADAVICRGTVAYTRHDGSELSVPFANILKMRDGLISEYLIYIDTSELYR